MAQTDLHMHSSVSVDGEVSPRGLAELCCQEGVTLAALTDHNDIAGTAEFIWRCAQLGVQAIAGVELDCMHEGTHLHVLGYGIDIANTALLHAVQAVHGLQAEAGLRLMDAVADGVDHLRSFCARDRVVGLERAISVTIDDTQRREHFYSFGLLNVSRIRECRTSKHGERASERQHQCENLFKILHGFFPP